MNHASQNTITKNIISIRSQIAEAEIKYGREPGSVQLLAVSKTRYFGFPLILPACKRSTQRPLWVLQSSWIVKCLLFLYFRRNCLRLSSRYGIAKQKRTSLSFCLNLNAKEESFTALEPNHDHVCPPSVLKAGPCVPIGFLPVNWNLRVRPVAPRTRKYQ